MPTGKASPTLEIIAYLILPFYGLLDLIDYLVRKYLGGER